MKKLFLLFFLVLTFNLQANELIKVIDLPNTKTYKLKSGQYFDIGYKYVTYSKWFLSFGVSEEGWIGYIDDEQFLNLTQKQINLLLKVNGKTLPPKPELPIYKKYSGWIVLLVLTIGFGIRKIFTDIKEKKAGRQREIENARRWEEGAPARKKAEEARQKLEDTKFARARVYATLMSKSFNTSPELVVHILNELEKSASSDIGLNINVINNLSQEVSTITKETYSNYKSYLLPYNFFTSTKTRARERYIREQIENMFGVVYGEKICKVKDYSSTDNSPYIEINYIIADDVTFVTNSTRETDIGIVLPIIKWEFNLYDSQNNLLTSYDIQTRGLGSRTVSYKNNDDLFDKIAQLHVGDFSQELILKFGLNISELNIEEHMSVTLPTAIEEQFLEIQKEKELSDEIIQKERKKYYLQNTPVKERFNAVMQSFQKGSKDFGKYTKEEIKDLIKDEVYENGEEYVLENLEIFYENNIEIFKMGYTTAAMGVALMHETYMEIASGSVDLAASAISGGFDIDF